MIALGLLLAAMTISSAFVLAWGLRWRQLNDRPTHPVLSPSTTRSHT